MKTTALLTVQHIQTRRSKKGREVLGILEGYLNDNKPGTTMLMFPDPDCPENPFAWYVGDASQGIQKEMEIPMLGSLSFRKGCTLEVELDYEDKASAQRLKILSAQGLAFFSEYEGVVPKWLQKSEGPTRPVD